MSKNEEKGLVDFTEVVGNVGYGRTRSQVMNIAESVAIEKVILRKKKISQGWFRHFYECNSQLRLRKGDSTPIVHMDAMNNTKALNSYFALLKKIMKGTR